MATISSMGIGSGLDVASLVQQLVDAEGAPASFRLDRQETTFQAKLSALGAMKSSLSSFQTSLTSLKSASTFPARSATSSDSDVLTATAESTATQGIYNIEVLRTAQHHKMSSAAVASSTVFGGTAGNKLTFTIDGASFDVDLYNSGSGRTLSQIRDAINSALDNVGVTATLISGDGGLQKLVVTSDDSGYTKRLQVSQVGTPDLALATTNKLADGSTMVDLTDLDAELTVDGFTMTRASNTIDDVIGGVTLELVSPLVGTEVQLNIGLDKAGVKSKVESFISNYNTLMTTLRGLSSYDAETEQASVLLGDATVRSLQAQLRRTLSESIDDNANYGSLAEIGITTELDGSLELDETLFDAVLDDSFDDVGALFTSTNGYANQLDDLVDTYLDTEGILASRMDGLQSQIDDIDEQRETLSRRLSALTVRYTAQFNAMDTLLAQLQGTSSFLTQQLAALPGAGGGSSE